VRREDCRAEGREGVAVSLVAKLLLDTRNEVRPRSIQWKAVPGQLQIIKEVRRGDEGRRNQ